MVDPPWRVMGKKDSVTTNRVNESSEWSRSAIYWFLKD